MMIIGVLTSRTPADTKNERSGAPLTIFPAQWHSHSPAGQETATQLHLSDHGGPSSLILTDHQVMTKPSDMPSLVKVVEPH